MVNPENAPGDELTAINRLARAADSSALAEKAKDLRLSGSVRAWALRKLGNLNDPEVLEVLIECTKDPDLDVRLAAARAIGRVGDESAAPALLDVLETDQSPIARAWAAHSLGMVGAKGAAPALTMAVDSPSWQLRGAAAQALARLGAKEAKPAIAKATRRERNPLRKWRLWRELRRL